MNNDTERTDHERKADLRWKRVATIGTLADALARFLQLLMRDR